MRIVTFKRVLVAGLVLLPLLAIAQYLRPVPALDATPALASVERIPGSAPTLPWPSTGGAAVAVSGLGQLGAYGYASQRPMWSVTKVMAALVVLADHPLQPDQPGPSVEVSADDVRDYQQAQAAGESVVRVAAGERLSELQLLEAMLIPSGNNIARMAAGWDAGSEPSFVARLNQHAAALGMKQTHYEDASGASDRSVSTPTDLLILGEAAMSSPVISKIVGLAEVDLPVAGTQYNVNYALGQDGIVGIKTGSSPTGGTTYLFEAQQKLAAGLPVTVIGSVMGLATLADAFNEAKKLIAAVIGGLKVTTLVSAAQPVAFYQAPWDGRTEVVAVADVLMVTWPGLVQQRDYAIRPARAPLPAGSAVGSLTVQLGRQSVPVQLITANPLFAPGRLWRLTRI